MTNADQARADIVRGHKLITDAAKVLVSDELRAQFWSYFEDRAARAEEYLRECIEALKAPEAHSPGPNVRDIHGRVPPWCGNDSHARQMHGGHSYLSSISVAYLEVMVNGMLG